VEIVLYLMIVVGIAVQGEAVMLAACAGAFWGNLHLVPVALAGMVGAFLADWLYFTLGRRHGARLLTRYRWLRGRMDKTSELLAKKPVFAIMVLRSQIGMRVIGNFLLGASEIDRRRYLEVNALACMIWGIGVTLLCFYFYVFTEPMWRLVIEAWS